MENECESSQPKKRRVYWSKEIVVKTFLETCIHEIVLNGREGSSLRPVSWRNVAETLKKTHNFIVNQRQMKNHYDYLKGKYGAWFKLKNRRGNVYDPSTNTFNLSEEEWQIEMKSNKYVQRLRSAPLPFPELCVQLFDGIVFTEVGSCAPTSTLPNPSPVAPNLIEDSPVTPKLIEDPPVAPKLIEAPPVAPKLIEAPPAAPKLIEDSPVAPKLIEDSPVAPNLIEDLEVKDTQESCGSTRKCSLRSQTPIKKRKGKQPCNSIMDEDFVKAVKHVMDKQKGDDMAACIDKLDNLGWETNPCYDVALFLFGESADYRKLWLLLKDERCENWVRIMGRKHKLF